METLTLEGEQQQQSHDQAEIWFPTEIIEDIILRLPIKSILRFRSVSKPWLSLISNPSFTKLRLARATYNHHAGLLITATDKSSGELYILSAPRDGGPVTHLMTLQPCDRSLHVTKANYLNGLICCCFGNGLSDSKEPFFVNPSTREFFKLPNPPTNGSENVAYFFGFDEERNEHKILGIPIEGFEFGSPNARIQIVIFSMSNYSWRRIDVAIDSSSIYLLEITSSVCVNSTIYLMVRCKLHILAFDLRTEKFFVVKKPVEFDIKPAYLIKINGCLGVVSYKNVVRNNKIRIWMLQEYENHVWVKEIIEFPQNWCALGRPRPRNSINVDEIKFSLRKLSKSVISAHICNIKSGCFRSIQFTLDHPFLCSDTVHFHQINSFVESIMPL